MHSTCITEKIAYDGSQLRSHWIFEQTGKIGDAIVSFQGAANVGDAHMVDLEDRRAKAWIHSDLMLHFIVEHFDSDLERMILRQRLLAAICGEELRVMRPDAIIVRCGNDLHEGAAKLSVSIATRSPVSCLVHMGVNVISTHTPVPTKGLADYDIDPPQFASKVMGRYAEEIERACLARAKVRAVE